MRALDIIAKKRDAQSLTQEEIAWFIDAYTKGDLPDYQAAAYLMAVCIRGMNREETIHLTQAMAKSGDVLDLSSISDYAVDKHSSGGVGDKTSLVVMPLVASLGVPVAKMSGRGLGFSGGTLDKMESIAGFNVNLSDEQFIQLAKQHGLVLAGQTKDLAPADGKLYALRDVTATVPSTPLIASSIMSKKIAAGANGIVLDVKVGLGAFMPTLEAARDLAQTMVDIGQGIGRDMVAVISDMNQPLGYAVGNALEVEEAIQTLKGGGPPDLQTHCIEIAAYMLKLAGRGKKWSVLEEVKILLKQQIDNGQALSRFRQMVQAQGGDVNMVDDPRKLPQASLSEYVLVAQPGYIKQVNAQKVALAAMILGAGREKKDDTIDPAVGVKSYAKVGDKVKMGTQLFSVYANNEAKMEAAKKLLAEAIQYSDTPVEPLPLFYDVVMGINTPPES